MTHTNETPKQAARRLAAGAIRNGFKPEALHEYHGQDGTPLFWRIRAKHPDTGEKWIRPMKLNGQGYTLGEPGYPNGKPLYRLDELAARLAGDVYVVEGETCADALAKPGLLATTSGGADSAEKADWSILAGRTVTLWPDNDEAGRHYAEAVADILLGLGCTVHMIDVATLDLPPKGDAVDWLATHADVTAEEIAALPRMAMPGPLEAVRATIKVAAKGEHQEAESNASAGDIEDWPDPQPMPDGLPPVAAFDLAMLPDTLRPWAADICERVQCAPDFVAAAIMAGLGSLIGRKVGIRPQARTDWTVTPNQWALVVGRPGVLKSPALEAALSPIKRLAALATEAHQAEAKDYARAVKLAKLKAEEGEKAARKVLARAPETDVSDYLDGEEPEAPALRRYIAVDTNAASLGELHRQNPNGLLVHRDEMVSLLKSLDREDQAEARGFYLTGWNGDSSYTFDRIGRGLNLHIPAVCLSLLGSTQPGRIAEYIRHVVKGGAGDDGLIQRFGLLVWPDTGGDWRNVDRWPDGDAKRSAFKVFENMDTFTPEAIGTQRDADIDGEPEGLPYLRFDADGLGLFLEWRTDLETRLRGGDLHPAMESHLAKYRKLVPGLALVLHLAGGDTGPVSERATLQALAWAEYLETHARRAYASVTMPEAGAAKAIMMRIRKGDLPLTFASWQVWRPGWAQLSDRVQVAEALGLLVELGWLAASKTDTGGRPGTVYAVNPRGFA